MLENYYVTKSWVKISCLVACIFENIKFSTINYFSKYAFFDFFFTTAEFMEITNNRKFSLVRDSHNSLNVSELNRTIAEVKSNYVIGVKNKLRKFWLDNVHINLSKVCLSLSLKNIGSHIKFPFNGFIPQLESILWEDHWPKIGFCEQLHR